MEVCVFLAFSRMSKPLQDEIESYFDAAVNVEYYIAQVLKEAGLPEAEFIDQNIFNAVGIFISEKIL